MKIVLPENRDRRIETLERTVDYLQEQLTALENRLESLTSSVSGHRHWVTTESDSVESDAWYR